MPNAPLGNLIKCPHCNLEFELTETFASPQIEALKAKLQAAQDSELAVRKQKQLLEEKERTLQLELQRQLDAERERIRLKTSQEVLESVRLREMEKDKLIADLKKSLTDAQTKANQTSQQLQGEVQELDLERQLAAAFPQDQIEAIGKGVFGADIRHRVVSPRGHPCGSILWESKRTKTWTDAWTSKLKNDLLADKADIPAIISEVLPEAITTGIGLVDNVWVAKPALAIPLAMLLRKSLLDTAYQKLVGESKGTKAEIIYNYITSSEFHNQVVSMIEIYKDMQSQISHERTAFEKSWKLRESQVGRLLAGVSGIYGSMQDKVGNALPKVELLEL